MSKLDKKIIDDITELSKLMIKNNLSELEITNEKITYKMKKNLLENKNQFLNGCGNNFIYPFFTYIIWISRTFNLK